MGKEYAKGSTSRPADSSEETRYVRKKYMKQDGSLRNEDEFDKRAELEAREAEKKARRDRIENMSIKERLEIFYDTGLRGQGPARAKAAGKEAYKKSKERSRAQRKEGERNEMYPSKGTR